MSGQRRQKKSPLPPWATSLPDGRDKRFIQVGNSLLLSKSFQSITAGAQRLYFAMMMESGGKRNYEFSYRAAKKYGIPSTTYERCRDELILKGFICRIGNPERMQYAVSQYHFSNEWKNAESAPHFGESR